MIDFHCHLDLFKEPHAVIEKCKTDSIYVLSVTTTPSAFKITQKISSSAPKIRTALGLHPQLVHERQYEIELFESQIKEAKYIGEIGLDGSRDFNHSWEIQKRIFEQILKSVDQHGGRVMSIHTRNSASEVLNILEKYPSSGIPIFHWFSGNLSELKRAIDIGAWFSVNPVMVKSKKGAEILSLLPPERVLTETDGPFTSDGNLPLYPWNVVSAYRALSYAWKLPENLIEGKLLENLRCLVSLIGDDGEIMVTPKIS